MRNLHPRPHDHDGHIAWVADLLVWTAIGLFVLLNLVLMWRIATATV